MAEQLIAFNELASGASVRFTLVDGVQYLSVRDLIMVICDQNNDRAGKTWRNISESLKDEVRQLLTNFKFKGRGQQDQPVIQFQGALKLLMWLPGEKAKSFRSQAAEILTRYFAGDKTLLQGVWENAQSGAPVNQAARASMEIPEIDEYGEKRQKEV